MYFSAILLSHKARLLVSEDCHKYKHKEWQEGSSPTVMLNA